MPNDQFGEQTNTKGSGGRKGSTTIAEQVVVCCYRCKHHNLHLHVENWLSNYPYCDDTETFILFVYYISKMVITVDIHIEK